MTAAADDLRQRMQAALKQLDALAGAPSSTSQSRRRQKYVSALERMDKGQYGRCCRCGAALEAARLAADPATLHCIDCVLELDSDCR